MIGSFPTTNNLYVTSFLLLLKVAHDASPSFSPHFNHFQPVGSAAASQEILRTLKCQHYFHRPCLKDWLQVNRDCPLCREDLAKPPPTGPTGPTETEAEVDEPPVLPV